MTTILSTLTDRLAHRCARVVNRFDLSALFLFPSGCSDSYRYGVQAFGREQDTPSLLTWRASLFRLGFLLLPSLSSVSIYLGGSLTRRSEPSWRSV